MSVVMTIVINWMVIFTDSAEEEEEEDDDDVEIIDTPAMETRSRRQQPVMSSGRL